MNIQTLLVNLLGFLNDIILPALIALAFVIFLWHTTRFFIFEGDNQEKHAEARAYAIWSIMAFVIILSLWGIVNLFVSSLSFGPNESIVPDYMGAKQQ